jgi:hypothetical protein
MRKLLSRCLLYLGVMIAAAGCTNEEIGNSKDVDQDAIFFDYQVFGGEGNDYVTVLLQYRFGGPRGTTLLLESPSAVQLDGKPFPADSTKMTGAYYELQFPISSFDGEHTIVFTDVNKKEYRETFRFATLVLATAPGDTISKENDLQFELEGLDPEDYIRVVLTDTSRVNEGVNRLDTVKNGKLTISREDLEQLASGPLQLVLTRENEKPVKNGSPEGGRILLNYELRRELHLR